MKTFLVVGQDIGVAGPLADICDEIEKRGGECRRFLREPLPNDFASLLAASEEAVVICGMSSFEDRAASELRAARLADAWGAPRILFADIEPALDRPFFEKTRSWAAGFIVPNEQAAEKVRTTYPNAFVISEGNPDDEKNFYPKISREGSRRRSGVSGNIIFVLAPGGKDLAVNHLHFDAAARGLPRALKSMDRSVHGL